jgi:hypothetical protein
MNTISQYHLVARSKRNAFYDISLSKFGLMYLVHKESGINGKVINKRDWIFKSYNDADKFLKSKLNEKSNSKLSRKRHYYIA